AVAGFAAPATAQEIASGNDKVKLSISGQINRGVLYADDGTESNFMHVDNDNSSTRFRFIGSAKYDDEITVGTQMEVQIESDSTANINIDGSNTGGSTGFSERKLELFFDHTRMGRLWLGQGDTASNGTSEVDLSGVGVIGYSGVTDLAGGIDFGGIGSGTQVGDVFSNFDGLSRDDRIRYDTPSFSGFKLSASSAEGNKHDFAARFSGDLGGGLKLAAAAAWAKSATLDSQINGSLSVLHDSGFNVTFAGGQRTFRDPARIEDPVFYYAKLGYLWTGGIGDTAFAVDWEQANDVAVDDDEATTFGIFLVQKVASIATEFYIGARNYQLDRPGTNFDDVRAVLAGARIKF
ncbi:MAG: porin, partial [Alphaproteobacteria bacterium]